MQTIRPRYSTILTWNLLIFVFHILSFSLCTAQDQSVVNCTDMLGYHMTFLAIVVKSSGHSILNVLIKLSWEYTESSKTSHCYPSNFEFFLSYWSTLWVLYYVTRQPDKILDFLRVWVMEDAELDLATFEFKRIIHITLAPWHAATVALAAPQDPRQSTIIAATIWSRNFSTAFFATNFLRASFSFVVNWDGILDFNCYVVNVKWFQSQVQNLHWCARWGTWAWGRPQNDAWISMMRKVIDNSQKHLPKKIAVTLRWRKIIEQRVPGLSIFFDTRKRSNNRKQKTEIIPKWWFLVRSR